MTAPPNKVSVQRVLPIVEDYIERNNYVFTNDGCTGGVRRLSLAAGISPKLIYEVRNGRRENIDVNSLDKILTGLDMTHLTWWAPEDGGFKDVFDNLQAPSQEEKEKYLKYRGRRAQYNACKCGGQKYYNSEMCKTCHLEKRQAAARKCIDCGKILEGGRRKTESVRCWPCWDKFRKIDEESRKGYMERRDGVKRVLKKRIVKDDA